MEELISIVIPVYNKEDYILECVNTVKNQSLYNWEAIFIDDCSSDNSVEIIEKNKDKRFKIIKLDKNCGAANARNVGIEASTGSYICFLDADDLWKPEKLEKQYNFMKENNYSFTYTDYEYADKNGFGIGKRSKIPKTITYHEALKNTTIFTSTVMFDLCQIKKEDIFIMDVPYEDTATWWRILKKHHMAYGLQEILSLYRRSEKTLSSNKIVGMKRTWNLYRNVEGFSIVKSFYLFSHYAFNALKRRL